MRDIAELTDVDDPGWPAVLDAVREGQTSCEVLPADPEACRATLLQLQVTARSLLGAVVLNSGGLVLHHGWLRVYGGSGGADAAAGRVPRGHGPAARLITRSTPRTGRARTAPSRSGARAGRRRRCAA
ncbi:DUF2625 family protein [Lentzea pudingi]|uniref:DUF2625 family protein n=1 Tax=Lentzea pudingi TaxID=1789439 RepID=UPI00166AB21F